MKRFFVIVFMVTPFIANGQKSKYYGWWEHKGAFHVQDSLSLSALHELGAKYNQDDQKLAPLAETEIQFNEDSFKINYGISVATGDGDNRDYKWFTSLSGVWKIDDVTTFKKHGKKITIRENSFALGEETWKDSILNHTIEFAPPNADLISLKFIDGSKATGVFNTQKTYPYIWFYLEYGFGNIYTKFY